LLTLILWYLTKTEKIFFINSFKRK
jgi:hypothetical protein